MKKKKSFLSSFQQKNILKKTQYEEKSADFEPSQDSMKDFFGDSALCRRIRNGLWQTSPAFSAYLPWTWRQKSILFAFFLVLMSLAVLHVHTFMACLGFLSLLLWLPKSIFSLFGWKGPLSPSENSPFFLPIREKIPEIQNILQKFSKNRPRKTSHLQSSTSSWEDAPFWKNISDKETPSHSSWKCQAKHFKNWKKSPLKEEFFQKWPFSWQSSAQNTPTQWPKYTVFVPLFGEEPVLKTLIVALSCLRYPRDRLRIVFLLEKEDKKMEIAIKKQKILPHMSILQVPYCLPQTKPKALCYGMALHQGDLVTVFDAEDRPNPDQLWMAALFFSLVPKQVVCLQASLTFYNAHENWITKLCTLEYAHLFGILLPALASFALPIALGGTSNHFRATALIHAGGWDPYNVTEDADIGFRLARLGYKVATLPSFTYEEAPSHLRGWIFQRTRWLKGFLQTWIVHMRSPLSLLRDLGFSGFLIFQMFILGPLFFGILYPISLVLMVLFFFNDTSHFDFFDHLVRFFSYMIFFGGTLFSYATMLRGGHLEEYCLFLWKKETFWKSLLNTVTVFVAAPFYWILFSCACTFAFYQFFTNQYLWNKTKHGNKKIF